MLSRRAAKLDVALLRLLRARLVLTGERLLPRMLPRLQRAAPLRLRPLVRRR